MTKERFNELRAHPDTTCFEHEKVVNECLDEIERVVIKMLKLSCRKCGERINGYIEDGMCGLCADDARNGGL